MYPCRETEYRLVLWPCDSLSDNVYRNRPGEYLLSLQSNYRADPFEHNLAKMIWCVHPSTISSSPWSHNDAIPT